MSETEIANAVPPNVPPEPPAPDVVTTPEPPPVTAKRRRSAWPALGLLGFVVLAAGELFLWHLYQALPEKLAAAAPSSGTSADTSALTAQIATVQADVAALRKQAQQAPPPVAAAAAPAPAQPGQSQPQPAQVQQAQVQQAQTQQAETQQAETQQAEAQQAQALQQVQAQQQAVAQQAAQAQALLTQKLAAVTAQINAVQGQQATDHGALTTLQTNAADLGKITARISLLNKLGAARMALDAGQPLGDVPDAPPALAKFAHQAPPTQAELVLNFPAAARRAESASIAGNATGTYWSAVLARLENLVTISSGNRVLVGAPAAGAVTQARQKLDAGDLAGAVAALDALTPPTQAAMGDWLSQAKDLLAARAALISLTEQS